MAWLALISCVLGGWVVIAPFVFPWDVCPWVYGAAIIPGALVFLMGAGFFVSPRKGLAFLCFLAAALGVWIIVSPFAAGYAIVFDVVLANFLPGALIAIFSGLAGLLALRAS